MTRWSEVIGGREREIGCERLKFRKKVLKG